MDRNLKDMMLKKEEAKLCGDIKSCEDSIKQWNKMNRIDLWGWRFVKSKWHKNICNK